MQTALQIGTATLLLPLVAALMMLPGLMPSLALRRALRAPTAAVPPIAVGVSVGLLGVVAGLGYVVGWSLTVVSLVFGAAAVVLAAVLVGRRDWRSLRWEPYPWAIAAATALISLVQGAWITGDAPYHLAAVRSLLRFDRPLVTDPFYGTAHPPLDATSGIWHTALALTSGVSHVDILALWPAVTALASILLVLAFWTLCREVSRSDRAAALGTVGLVAITFFGDLRWMAYPGYASRGLLFIALYVVVRALQVPGRAAALGVAALGIATVSMHLGTAEVYFMAVGCLLVAGIVSWWRGAAPPGAAKRGTLTLAAGLALVLAVTGPQLYLRVSTIAGLKTPSSGIDLANRYFAPLPGFAFRLPQWFWGNASLAWLAAGVALILGLANLLVFGLMVWRAVVRPTRWAWAGAAVVAVPVLLQTPVLGLVLGMRSPYMLVRLLDIAEGLAFVGLAWAIARRRMCGLPVRAIALAAGGLAVACALPSIVSTYVTPVLGTPAVNPTILAMRRQDYRNEWGVAALARLRSVVGDTYPRVGADASTGYHMLAYVPVAIAASPQVHTPSFIESVDGPQRRADMETLLNPDTPLARRIEIIRRYGLDYVAVSRGTARYLKAARTLGLESSVFEPVVIADHLWVFRVLPSALGK